MKNADDYDRKMSSTSRATLTTEEVLSRVLDADFGLSEDDSSDEEGEGISSYLEKGCVDPEAVLSLGRQVVGDLPASDPSACIQDSYLQPSSDEESFDGKFSHI